MSLTNIFKISGGNTSEMMDNLHENSNWWWSWEMKQNMEFFPFDLFTGQCLIFLIMISMSINDRNVAVYTLESINALCTSSFYLIRIWKSSGHNGRCIKIWRPDTLILWAKWTLRVVYAAKVKLLCACSRFCVKTRFHIKAILKHVDLIYLNP